MSYFTLPYYIVVANTSRVAIICHITPGINKYTVRSVFTKLYIICYLNHFPMITYLSRWLDGTLVGPDVTLALSKYGHVRDRIILTAVQNTGRQNLRISELVVKIRTHRIPIVIVHAPLILFLFLYSSLHYE